MSTLSSPDLDLYQYSQCQSFLQPDQIQDHNNDIVDDVELFWWFPSDYYSLLSPSDYNDLFGEEDEETADMINENEETKDMINKDEETVEMINEDEETAEMINDDVETVEMINDDVETLSRSAAKRNIYIFVVQKILQNYNFSPGQELSMTITKKKKVKEKRLTPNSSCGILEKKRGLRGKRRVMPHHDPVHPYCPMLQSDWSIVVC